MACLVLRLQRGLLGKVDIDILGADQAGDLHLQIADGSVADTTEAAGYDRVFVRIRYAFELAADEALGEQRVQVAGFAVVGIARHGKQQQPVFGFPVDPAHAVFLNRQRQDRDDGELRFATNVGVRIHGSKHDRQIRTNVLDQSYRLYFRSLYGVRKLSPRTVFDGGAGVRRPFIRKEGLFAAELALDIARRLGAQTPEYQPVIFYLNGKKMGIRTLSEQLSAPQWAARMGQEDFHFFKYKGTSDADSKAGYGDLGRWFHRNRATMDMEMAGRYVDVKNLTRNLFTFMFCGTNDWYQGAAVLDRRDPGAK